PRGPSGDAPPPPRPRAPARRRARPPRTARVGYSGTGRRTCDESRPASSRDLPGSRRSPASRRRGLTLLRSIRGAHPIPQNHDRTKRQEGEERGTPGEIIAHPEPHEAPRTSPAPPPPPSRPGPPNPRETLTRLAVSPPKD